MTDLDFDIQADEQMDKDLPVDYWPHQDEIDN